MKTLQKKGKRVTKTIFLIFCLLLYSNFSEAQIRYAEYFSDKVLRIDLLRSGNALKDSLKITSLYTEEFWSGCRTKTIDVYEYGDYKVEINDISNGMLLFSYSYSSLFSEYLFTEQGRNESKDFQETLRIPFPKKTISIAFFKRPKGTEGWIEELRLTFNPNKPPMIVNTVVSTTKMRKIIDSGEPEHHVDIAFISEGYTLDEQMKFIEDSKRISEYLLNCEPFSLHKDRMNIWAVFSPSDESGVTDPSENSVKETALGFNFSTFGTDRYLMTENHFALRNAASAVPYDHLIVIVNTDKYGGGGIYNFYASCPSDNSETAFLVVHEFGHSFAGLADEYWTSDVSVTAYYNLETEPVEPNITTLVNFQSKWQDLIEEETPVPTPNEKKYRTTTGVFEGGGYVEKGIYRPYYDCTMKSVQYNAFCPVCRRAIEETIRLYSE